MECIVIIGELNLGLGLSKEGHSEDFIESTGVL